MPNVPVNPAGHLATINCDSINIENILQTTCPSSSSQFSPGGKREYKYEAKIIKQQREMNYGGCRASLVGGGVYIDILKYDSKDYAKQKLDYDLYENSQLTLGKEKVEQITGLGDGAVLLGKSLFVHKGNYVIFTSPSRCFEGEKGKQAVVEVLNSLS